MVKKISSIVFKLASLKGMEYHIISLYFNWKFSWPVTFTFFQHYPIIDQHSFFLEGRYWSLGHPIACHPGEVIKAPFSQSTLSGPHLQASTVFPILGKQRKNQAGFWFSCRESLILQEAHAMSHLLESRKTATGQDTSES